MGPRSGRSKVRRHPRHLVLSAPIRDGGSTREKEGAVRRRLVALTGHCPCGAVLDLSDIEPGTLTTVRVVHEPDCPAVER